MGQGDAGVEIVQAMSATEEVGFFAQWRVRGSFTSPSLLGAAPVDRGRFLEVNARGTKTS